MPLPSFAVTPANVFDILGNVAGGEIVGNAPVGTTPAKVTFTSNVPKNTFVTWAGDIYRVDRVVATVNSDGEILRNGEPVLLLAADPGLSVEGLQWTCKIGGMKPITFDAASDGGTIDLSTVAPAASLPAVGLVSLPVSGLSDATAYMKGLLTAADDATEARSILGVTGGGGGGTVATVVAGSNIDVDSTDPANPVVSVETLTVADISGLTPTVTELNYVDGVTSAIQTQIDSKQPLDADLTALAALTAPATKLTGIATGATANDTDANLRARASHTGTQTSSTISDFQEAAQDAVAALLAQGTNVTLTYDDAGNTLTVAAGGGGGLDAEAVRDAIGVAMVGVGNITVTVNDAADTITISTTATVNDTDANLKARANHTGTQSADTIVDGSTNHVFTAADDTKLGGVATGATANDTDANLKARANHTGSQAASTISDFSTAADARIAAAVGVSVQALDADLTALAALTAPATKLAGIANGAEVNVNADWDAVSGDAQILNKPALPVSPVAMGVGLYGASVESVSSSTATTGRVPVRCTVAATAAQFAWTNARPAASTAVETDNGTITMKAAIELDGNIIPLTFNGLTTVTVDAGATVLSDPVGYLFAPGTDYYVRTRIASGTWYASRIAYVAGMGGSTTTDAVAAGTVAGSAISDATFFTGIPAPNAMIGMTNSPSIFVIGDSIGYGSSDGVGNGLGCGVHTTNEKHGQGGWVGRACIDAGIGVISVAAPSDKIATYLTRHVRRSPLGKYARTALIEYPRNDLSSSDTLAVIQANIIKAGVELNLMGSRVFVATACPQSTSTDGWTTTTNQTAASNPTKRNDYNAWLRDGAPMIAGVAVATGSAIGTESRCSVFSGNTVVVAASGSAHPFYGVMDVGSEAETTTTSNIWLAAINIRSVSDAATTAASSTITSATATFISGDVGKQVVIEGAGTAGARHVGYIKSVTNGTTAVLAANVPTTVSGAVMKIGDYYTTDGIHPHHTAIVAMAAKVPTNHII